MKNIIYILFLLIHLNGFSQTWSAVGTGTSDDTWELSVYNSELFVGGQFDVAGGLICNKMAKWNGTNWDTIPGVPGGDNISAFESFNGEFYIGRGFSPFIHKWNGSAWSFVGTGLNNVVVDMIEFNSELYAGGIFTTAGGNPANRIAKWNGTTWSAVGTGMNKDVLSLAVYKGELYAAGRFDTASEYNVVNHIAKWSGNFWVPLGAGVNGGAVSAMAVYKDELYVCGNFTTAGGLASPLIARWNGSSWNTVSTGIAGIAVGSFAEYNGELYTGGLFDSAGIVPANNIAKWDGINWSALGSTNNGITGFVDALAVYNNELYVSGRISDAGGISVNNIARWSTTTTILENDFNNSIKVLPNPFSNELLLSGTNQKGRIELFDLTGKEIMRNNTLENETKLNTENLLPGFYMLKYVEQNKSVNLKLMKL